ncbi:hypothetical protein RHGRI_024813 [Rhododendron griersonianum]|uniref:DUF908 domain-containing protein n=1 Tax=Rhododendron griersonianum TaxID=479676 RepID=A0AAV6JAX2_9ERIC|nr:hypothetical protein RHGRI_024813 [Rhododendron griersonianum]
MAKRRVERERGRGEATADMYEDLSEGEKEDTVSDLSTLSESNRSLLPKIGSVEMMEAWVSQQKGIGRRTADGMVFGKMESPNLHGLIRGKNMELGRDSDTGGQVKYVVKLERALGSMPGVYRVDILTRQVSAPNVDWSYGEPTEMLPRRNSGGLTDEMGESSRAYSIHIPFGPRNKYLPKESLWPYVPEFIDGALNHILQMSEELGEQIGSGHPVWSVAIHGHYADAGDAAALLSGALNVPMLFTDHSLGRDRLEQLLRQGRLSKDEINATYKIMHRIEAEELALDASEIVITSTRQEIEEQWRLYDGFDLVLECKLLARIRRNVSCYGRFMPHMVTAAYGLSIVATKNGGPVVILRVLDNGFLINPHDEKSIPHALLKLDADRQLWAKCRQNGLKNIHPFSWLEHCKTYLSGIAVCKLRQPWWQRNDDGDENSELDSPSDSLRDRQDISLNLKFLMDGENNSGSGNADSSLESKDRKSKLENAVLTWSKGVLKGPQKAGLWEKADHNSSAGKFPALRRRKLMIVIAVDFDDISDIFSSARKIFDAVEKERTEGSMGFILATSFTLAEMHSFLISGGLSPTDFDAFICNSGSDLYYSSPNSDDNPFVVDLYCYSHSEYRWGGEGLRKTLVHWAGSITDKKGENEEQIVTEDGKISTSDCYSFKPPNVKSFVKGVIVTPLENVEEALKGFVWDFEKGDFHDRVYLFSHFNTVFIKTRKDFHVENNFLEFDPAFPREAESSDELLAAEQGLQIIHLPNINTHQESDLELLNKLVMDFKVPLSLRFSLLIRLRFARAFSSLAARQQYTCICPYALVVLVQACGNTDGLDSFFDAEPELVSLLSYNDSVSEKIRSLTPLSLVALCPDWSQQPSVLIAVTSGGHHGILSSLMHKPIDSIVSNSSKRSVVFAEALSSLVTVLVSSSSGCLAIREAGFIPRLLPLRKDTDPQHLHLVSMAVHDLEAFMGYSNPAAALFRDLGGLDDTISQLKVEKSYVDDGSKQRCTSTELDSSESIQVGAGVSSKLYNMHPLYSGALENISTHKVERHVGFSLLGVGKTIRSLLLVFIVLFSLLINVIGQVPVPKPDHYKIVWRAWGSASNMEIACPAPVPRNRMYKAPEIGRPEFEEYWPNLEEGEDFLWKHEWEAHGYCLFSSTDEYVRFTSKAVREITIAFKGSTILDVLRPTVQDPKGGPDPIKVKPHVILYEIKTALEGHLDVLVSCNWNKVGVQQLHEIYFCVTPPPQPKLINCIKSISNCRSVVELPSPPKPLPSLPPLKKLKQQKTSLPTPKPLPKKRFAWQSQQQTTLKIPQQKQLLIRKGKEPLQEPQPQEPFPTPLPTRQQQQQKKKQQHQKKQKQQQTQGQPLLMKEPVLPRPPKWELPSLPTLFTTTVLVIAVLCLMHAVGGGCEEEKERTRHRPNLSRVGNQPITPQKRHLEGAGHGESSTCSSGSTARSRRSEASGPSLTLGPYRAERPKARTRLDFDMNYPPLREKHVRSRFQPSGEETLGHHRADSRDNHRE